MRNCNAFCETCGAWHRGRNFLCSGRLWLFYECIVFKTYSKYVSAFYRVLLMLTNLLDLRYEG
jgi:hypothetical protein